MPKHDEESPRPGVLIEVIGARAGETNRHGAARWHLADSGLAL